MLLAMLAGEGIGAHLHGQHLLGGIGELPAAGLLWLGVANADAERARALIEAYNAAQPLPMEPPEGGPEVLLC